MKPMKFGPRKGQHQHLLTPEAPFSVNYCLFAKGLRKRSKCATASSSMYVCDLFKTNISHRTFSIPIVHNPFDRVLTKLIRDVPIFLSLYERIILFPMGQECIYSSYPLTSTLLLYSQEFSVSLQYEAFRLLQFHTIQVLQKSVLI